MTTLHDYAIAHTHAGADTGRYSVNGVQLRAGGQLVATDSRRMLRITPKTPDAAIERTALVHRDTLPKLAGSQARKTALRVNGCVSWTGPMGSGEMSKDSELVGDFPDADRVMQPCAARKPQLSLNPSFLADAGKAITDFLTARCDPKQSNPLLCVDLHHNESSGMLTLRAEAHNGDAIEVLLMAITAR